jgi:hypothetical protein
MKSNQGLMPSQFGEIEEVPTTCQRSKYEYEEQKKSQDFHDESFLQHSEMGIKRL